MSIQRIDCDRTGTHGWQARWPVPKSYWPVYGKRLTAYFSERAWGLRGARKRALRREGELRAYVRAMLL